MTADLVVIGAGIVGLATANAFLAGHPGAEVVVMEKEPAVARHQTGRNSGVLHSGLYYPPGSLKARLCRDGAEQLVRFCQEEGVALERNGKLVVASSAAELPRLHELGERGVANVLNIAVLGPEALKEHEPHAAGFGALLVPEAGVVEYPEVAARLRSRIELAGGTVETGMRVEGLHEGIDAVEVRGDDWVRTSRALVNCAGLYSDRVAALMGVDAGVRIVPFRGEYFELVGAARKLVKTAIYPVPDPALPFLGVHLTRRATGVVEAGPNAVPAFAREGYKWSSVNLGELKDALLYRGTQQMMMSYWRYGIAEMWRSASKRSFTRSVQRLVPEVGSDDLRKAGSGVRAQAMTSAGRLVDDFLIEQTDRSVHVLNAPSPAATASLAIGAHIAHRASRLLAG